MSGDSSETDEFSVSEWMKKALLTWHSADSIVIIFAIVNF
jgi:hypothetical protein